MTFRRQPASPRRHRKIEFRRRAQSAGGSNPPGETGLIFFSDWAGRAGTTGDAARSDGGKWTGGNGDDNGVDVIASTGLDFPTTDCIRLWVRNPQGGANISKDDMPVPDVGTSVFYRWYMRVTLPDDYAPDDNQTHPIQVGQAGSQTNWMFLVNNYPYNLNPAGALEEGEWSAEFSIDGGAGPRFAFPPLLKGVSYRFEAKMTRDGEDTMKLWGRCYTAADEQLLYDESECIRIGSGSPSMATYYASNSDDINVLSSFNHFHCGHNGLEIFDDETVQDPETFDLEDAIYGYQTGFAVSTEDWIGAYPTEDEA